MMGLVNTTKINIARWWTQPTFSWLRQQYLLGTRWCQCECKRSCISFLQTLAKCFGIFGSSISNHVWFRWCMEIEGVAFPVTYIPPYTIPRPFSRGPYGEIRTEKKGLIDALEKQGSLTKFWDLLSREFVPKTSVIFCWVERASPSQTTEFEWQVDNRAQQFRGKYVPELAVMGFVSAECLKILVLRNGSLPNSKRTPWIPRRPRRNHCKFKNNNKSTKIRQFKYTGDWWALLNWDLSSPMYIYIYSCKLPPHSEFGS